MPVRLSVNALLPRYAAAPEEAGADAAQWPRTLFSEGKGVSAEDLQWLATGISSMVAKREERVGYFVAILRDETKPRPVREASLSALRERDCFDYDHPAAQASSNVFEAVVALVKSGDGKIREDAMRWLYLVCHTIKSRQARVARAKEAIASLDAAAAQEPDQEMRDFIQSCRADLDLIVTDRWPDEDYLTE
jgi:hypothetical protein